GVLGDDQLHPDQHQLDHRDRKEGEGGRDVEQADGLVVRAGGALDPGLPAGREPLGDDLRAGGGDRATQGRAAPGAALFWMLFWMIVWAAVSCFRFCLTNCW